MLSIKLASEEEDSSPERSVPFNDESRLKPRNNALMDEDCRKDLPPSDSQYMVVGGMNVDMMDMDMTEEDRKSP